MRRLILFAFLLLFAGAAAAETAPSFTRERTFQLDASLREISGLAPAGSHSVFAHNDEFAIIHEIDIDTGAIIRSFAFGQPTVNGDFEGIARVGDEIWLVTGDGRLLEGKIRKHAKRTRFNMYDTGVGKYCETEGLAPAPGPDSFFILCKKLLNDDANDLRIYQWSLADRFSDPKLVVNAPLASLAPAAVAAEFHPADLSRIASSGNFWILDAAGNLLEITAAGKLARYISLDRSLHPQSEGLAFLPDGQIAIADEGKKREAVLSIYRDH